MRWSMILLLALLGAPPPAAGQDTFELVPLADDIWAAVVVPRPPAYAFANSLVVVGEDGVLVVDTQQSPTAARALVEEVRQRTDRPVRWVVNTHWHPDHVAGNGAWRDAFPDVQILGHRSLVEDVPREGEAWRLGEMESLPGSIEDRRRWLRDGVGPDDQPLDDRGRESVTYSLRLREAYLDELQDLELVPPDRTFERRQEVDLGGRVVRLLHLGPAHTRGDVLVHLPEEGIVAVGDLLEHALPWLGDGDVAGWASALDTLGALDASIHVPAHGPPVRDGTLLEDYRALFGAMVRAGHETACGRAPDVAAAAADLAPAFQERYGVSPERLEEGLRAGVEQAAGEVPDEECGTGPADRTTEHDEQSVPWGRYEGLWDLEDGRRLVVTDLVDQMPENANQLMVLEPFSGLVRTLHPVEGDQATFAVGAGFFQLEPVEGTLTFHLAAAAAGDSVRWTGADGGAYTGRRSGVRERDVTFEAQDGVRLAGSLLLPPDSIAPPWPAVVFVHGSGPLTRRSPRQVGYQLAAAGVAVLAFDKRGTGASEGTYRANALDQQARDAVAAVDFVRSRPELDPERVAVHAASEGGFVAPMILEARPDVAALVCRVCSILPWSEALPHYIRGQLEGTDVPPEQVEEGVAYVRAQVRFALEDDEDAYADLVRRYRAGEGSDWLGVLGLQPPAPPDGPSWEAFRNFLTPDPTELYRDIDIPVLVILGEADPRVPGRIHGLRARELLAGSPSPAWAVRVLPDANHGLMVVGRGPEGESLAPTRYAPDLHRDLVDWIRLILDSDGPTVGPDPGQEEGQRP